MTPVPLLAPYAGTKAYNDAFPISLNEEVCHKNVLVHYLTHFIVESAMANMRASFTVPTADRFADMAVATCRILPEIATLLGPFPNADCRWHAAFEATGWLCCQIS